MFGVDCVCVVMLPFLLIIKCQAAVDCGFHYSAKSQIKVPEMNQSELKCMEFGSGFDFAQPDLQATPGTE